MSGRSRAGLNALAGSQLDLLVVGGGITGACVLLEASRRGLRAGLVEREDFGAGATANCLKIVHGGLRYLQQADIRRVRESAMARRLWLRSAPHLVEPLPVVFPTYRRVFPSRGALAGALVVNRALDLRRNRGLVPERTIPEPRVLSRAECARLAPLVDSDDLTGGVLFHDALVYSPERLTLEVILAAEALGAVASNHTEFVSPRAEGGRVTGAHLRDTLTGETTDVGARWVVNATGAWAGDMVKRLVGEARSREQAYSVALNLVTRFPARGPAFSLAGPRRLFAVPWRGQLMIGTGHLRYHGDPADFRLAPEQVEQFATEVRKTAPELRLDPADIAVVHAGLLPVTDQRTGEGVRLLRRHRILDHQPDGLTGAWSVVTVKMTTAPTVAREVLDRLGAHTGVAAGAVLPLPGGEFDSLETLRRDTTVELDSVTDNEVVEHLLRTYGARWRQVVELRQDHPGWNERVVPEAPVVRAQLVHAVRAEGARTVDDLLRRRTELGPRGLITAAARQVAEEVLSSFQPTGTESGGRSHA